MRDVVVVDSVRTGLAKSFRGTFNLTRPDDMVAHCIDALLERNPKLDPVEVEDVIVGAASQTGEQGGNIARLAVILSQLPVTTAGSTISRAATCWRFERRRAACSPTCAPTARSSAC